jgi:hypothetical protein
MATLHKEYNQFKKEILLEDKEKKGLKKSRKALRETIRNWFLDNKSDKLQPKFHSQGSFMMNTIINPIPVPSQEEKDKKLYKYDLDDGIYFIENANENNKENISTWHNWVYEAVNNHTKKETKRKQACVRVIFAYGHHIDLPIYYQLNENGTPELAHRSKDWIDSDPKKFTEWFNNKVEGKSQITRLVQYAKAWKDFRQVKNTNLKLPSGFALTILIVNNYVKNDNDDAAFRETMRTILKELCKEGSFQCLRPTTPKGDDVFLDYSETRKSNFLNTLESLIIDCDRARDQQNFKKASEYLLNYQFGPRFPKGENIDESEKKKSMDKSLNSEKVKPKPYADERRS